MSPPTKVGVCVLGAFAVSGSRIIIGVSRVCAPLLLSLCFRSFTVTLSLSACITTAHLEVLQSEVDGQDNTDQIRSILTAREQAATQPATRSRALTVTGFLPKPLGFIPPETPAEGAFR